MNSTDLPNVVWIGGSPCAGKSSIADAIARDRGWTVYRCDDEVVRHAHLADPVRQPVFTKLNQLSCDELWLRPLDEQVEEEFTFYREEFPFILDDLARFPSGQTVLAEGAALLPELVDPNAVAQGRGIWIVPTKAFQLEHYGRRAWPADTLANCTDRATAWSNWMERDVRFAHAVAASARALAYPLLLVNGATSLDENIATVDCLLNYSAR